MDDGHLWICRSVHGPLLMSLKAVCMRLWCMLEGRMCYMSETRTHIQCDRGGVRVLGSQEFYVVRVVK